MTLPQIEGITSAGFPDQNASPETKAKESYGVSYAMAIYSSFYRNSEMNARRLKIQENRLYAQGRQNPDQYKPWLNAKIDNAGDQSYMNLNWSIVSPAPKMVNSIINRIDNQDYRITYDAVDPASYSRRKKDRDKIFEKMLMIQALKPLEEQTGVPLVPVGDIPEDIEDVNMYMDMYYKLPIEMGMEELIDWELYNNDFYTNVKNRIIRDIVENNKGAGRLYFDSYGCPRIRYVDIENLMHTYSDDPYFKDIDYAGEICFFTVRQLREMTDGGMDETKMFELAKLNAGRYGNPQWAYGNYYIATQEMNNIRYAYDDFRVMCLDFTFYSINRKKTETRNDKYGNSRTKKVSSDYQPSEYSKKTYGAEVTEKTEECEYEGIWALGMNWMVKYGKAENIMYEYKAGKKTGKCLRKYIICQPGLRYGVSQSIVDRMKGDLDDIQLANLQMRHFVAEAAPPGVAIDTSTLIGAMKMIKTTNPLDLVALFKQKGILFYDGTDDNGMPMNRKPIEEMVNGLGTGLQPFMENIKFHDAQLRELTGYNDSMDQMEPDSKALVGVQKLALVAANTNIMELYKGFYEGIFEPIGRNGGRMIQLYIKHGDGKRRYEHVIGKVGVDFVEFLGDVSEAELGVKVMAMPTGEELQRLTQVIAEASTNMLISPDAAYEIAQIPNPKKAFMYLKYSMKKKIQSDMKIAAEKEQMIGQREQATAMASAEAEKIKQKAKAESEIAVLEAAKFTKIVEIEALTKKELAVVDRKGEWELKKIQQAFKYKDTPNTESTDVVPGVDDPEINSDPAEAATRFE